MKNLKTTILSAFIAICCLTNGNAQETARLKNRGKVVMTGRPGSIVVFGGGTSMPSSDGKDKAFLSNTTAINADAFFSLISKPEGNFSFGLNFGGAYNFGGSGGFGTTPNPFAVTGQTSSVVSDRGVDPKSPGFRMGAGPQANFYFGKFIVSPMVLGEYFSMTQKEMSIVQTTQFNGQSYDFNLATLPETKTSGFAVTPKLRLHYMFNDRFGLFADASYTTGPKIETTVSKLIPNGNPSPQSNSYNIQQLQTGTMVKGETKSTTYSAMGFNFGVVIGLGKNKHDTTKNSVSSVRRTAGGTLIDDTPTAQKIKTKSNSTNERTAGDIKKGWDGKLVDMVVPNASGNNSNIENITIKGSGEFTNNGIPIVYGKTVTGNVKAAKGKSNSNIAIKIEQKESNDIANAITDEKGNFSMELAQDTLHGLSVNNVEYGKIKILDAPINNDNIRKGWNGKIDENIEGKTLAIKPVGIKADDSFLKNTSFNLDKSQVELFLKDLKITENGIDKLNTKYFKQVKNVEDIGTHQFILTESKTNAKYVFLGDEIKLYQSIKLSNSQDTNPNAIPCGGTCCCRTCADSKGNETCYDCTCWRDFCYCPLCMNKTYTSESNTEK